MGCDSICDLPDSLLTRILLNLPTKDSVKTSVLSKRWRNLWLSVPGLDLETIDFFPYQEVFERFMDRFMEFNRGSRLLKFDIMYEDFDRYGDRFMELIGTVVDCGIQHLHVFMYICNFRDDFMRQNIYKSKTLVSLKLDNVELKNPEFTVSLPCLKILHLCTVCFGKDGPLVVEKLLLGCPVLEDLKLITPFDILNEQGLLFLHVRSQTVKRCCLGFGDSRADTDFMVEIDAPKLEYMSLSQSQSDSIVVKNLSSLFMLDIQTNSDFKSGSPLTLEDFDIFCDFLSGISSVRRMIIWQETLEVLYCYSKLGPIPKFHNLYHLQVKFFNSSVQLLPALLETCPNLKNLVVDYYVTGEPEQINFTNVPRCLILTLENVEIKELTMKGETGIKVVNYFLENSAVLKKLTLSFRYPSVTKQEAKSYKKLLTSTKLSPTCQVIYKVRCL